MIDEGILLQNDARSEASLDVEFKKLLALLITGDLENTALTDEQFLLNIREVEALLSALCNQYENQLDELPISDKALIKKILIILIKELMRFEHAGIYSREQLEEAFDYLTDIPPPPHFCCHDSFQIDNMNRIRAFLNRLFRPINQLISAFINSSHLKNNLNMVSTAFIYLAWIFPTLRLLCRLEKILQHGCGFIGISEDEKKLPATVRLRSQIIITDITRDVIQMLIRLVGCFVFSDYTTHVTFTLFSIRLIESVILCTSEPTPTNKRFMTYQDQQNETTQRLIPLSFFSDAIRHKQEKIKNNNVSKLTFSLSYELGIVISLLGVVDIGLNKNTATGLSILGAAMIALICMIDTVSNFSRSSAIFHVKKQEMSPANENAIPLIA